MIWLVIKTLAFAVACLFSLRAGAADTAAFEPFQLHPENPHYFLFRGKPTLLISSGEPGRPIDNTATGVSIGREQYAGSLPAGRWFFNGQLDDVRIYERALSQAEIQSVVIGQPPARSQIAGVGLVFNGTGGFPGGTYYVLTSTNTTLPLSGWTRVMTNSPRDLTTTAEIEAWGREAFKSFERIEQSPMCRTKGVRKWCAAQTAAEERSATCACRTAWKLLAAS